MLLLNHIQIYLQVLLVMQIRPEMKVYPFKYGAGFQFAIEIEIAIIDIKTRKIQLA